MHMTALLSDNTPIILDAIEISIEINGNAQSSTFLHTNLFSSCKTKKNPMFSTNELYRAFFNVIGTLLLFDSTSNLFSQFLALYEFVCMYICMVISTSFYGGT